MYDSGVSVTSLLSLLKEEVDIVGVISDEHYLRWVSSLEQLLYADIIAQYRITTVLLEEGRFSLSSLSVTEGERAVRFDDIVKIYVDIEEIIRSGLIAAHQFASDKSIYYLDGEDVRVRYFGGDPSEVCVITRVVPAIKTEAESTVKVPYEWLDMVLSKLRGEAYKIANDDAQAAKWLGDFNTQLESFKVWVGERQKWYGE